jgi:hypothetical protein
MKFTTDAPFESSCLQGYVEVNYTDLVDCFGPPNCDGDGYKVDAEWMIKFEDGTYATIYNYKDGKNYCGEDGLDVEDIKCWHVGGMSKQSLWAVQDTLTSFDRNTIEGEVREIKDTLLLA